MLLTGGGRQQGRFAPGPHLRGSFGRCIVDFKSACFFASVAFMLLTQISDVATVGPRPHQTLLSIGIHNSEDNRQLLVSRCCIFRARLPGRVIAHTRCVP